MSDRIDEIRRGDELNETIKVQSAAVISGWAGFEYANGTKDQMPIVGVDIVGSTPKGEVREFSLIFAVDQTHELVELMHKASHQAIDDAAENN